VSELVSVVVCAYNNWPDLGLAIQSALCQSHRSLDVIVVDNSSTDATAAEVSKSFGNHIRYLRQPNRLDSGAYNVGLRQARGEFVQFLDGDDVLAPDKIERQLHIFRSDPSADIVFGDVRLFHDVAGQPDWTDIDIGPQVSIDLFLDNEGYCVGSLLGVLFRRSTLDRLGEWDEAMYRADADYFLRAAAAGCQFRYSAGVPVAFKRVRSGQMGLDAGMLEGSEALWAKALTYFPKPFQDRIRINLARAKFLRACREPGLTRSQAIALCREARKTSGTAIRWPAYLAARLMLILPGRTGLASSARFRALRRALLRLAGYRSG